MQAELVGGCHHPATGEPAAFRFDDRYWGIRRQGPMWLLADVLSIPAVVRSPVRVFKGLKREGKDNAFALMGRPTHRFMFRDAAEPIEVPVSGKRLFFVYVCEDLCIYHHAWVDLDFEFPGLSAVQAEDRYVTMCFDKEIPNARKQ